MQKAKLRPAVAARCCCGCTRAGGWRTVARTAAQQREDYWQQPLLLPGYVPRLIAPK
ncbi:MAG TPA: hypothetical protein PKD90_12330 [Phnomibacter sp.]|nr:hypothetical protein [Phnomibacter sp.]